MEYLGRDGHPRAARQLHKLNLGPRLGIVGRVTDKTVARAGYGMVWIEMAGITTPFTTPGVSVPPDGDAAHARQHHAGVRAGGGTPRGADSADAECRPRPGVFSVDRDLGSGYVQQWNTSVQRELSADIALEVAYTGSKITRVGLPDTNLNQLSVEQLAQGAALQQRVANPFFGIDPAVIVARRPHDSRGPAAQTLSAVHDRQPLSQQRGHHHLPRRLHQAGAAPVRRPVLRGQLHPLEARGRRLVGLRRVDPDGSGGELSGGRQLQPQARARLLERRHPARLRGLRGVGYCRGGASRWPAC